MKIKNSFLYVALFLSLIPSAIVWGGQGDPNTVVAEVLGRKITEAELFQSIGADLYQLESRVLS